MSLPKLLREIRACRHCEAHLPLGPRPVLAARRTATILIAGQAPGTRVHETGIPWNDPSGDRLRDWLQVDREVFYDDRRIAIIPMGFCYPGKGKSGDLPPRPECAPLWQDRLRRELPELKLVLALGMYAQKWHLGDRRGKTLTDTVRAWRDFAPGIVPLPHPSPRNVGWFKKNPWFDAELVPAVRERVSELLHRA
ncbi:MAG: uracil-DNA glycosylase family protein [Pseudomonadota bacterium]